MEQKKKRLLLTIKGVQRGFGQEEVSEIVAAAEYYRKKDRNYLFYTETTEEGFLRKNRLTIGADTVELRKSGGGDSVLRFRQGHTEPCVYQSPAGPLPMMSETKKIELEEKKDSLKLRLEYSFSMSGRLVSEYTLTVEGRPLSEK